MDILELVPLDVGVGFLALGTLETCFVEDEERSIGEEGPKECSAGLHAVGIVEPLPGNPMPPAEQNCQTLPGYCDVCV